MVRFEISDCSDQDVARLVGQLPCSQAVAQVLVRRGYRDPRRARAFLAADERHGLESFAGLREAAESIVARARAARQITVYGDYDVDGVCSTAVLVCTLRKLGAKVDWYLPDRATDGYGLSAANVEKLAARGSELLITVDCGITAVQEVALARSLGLEVIVSDHHLPRADGALPQATILHPRICGYPCVDLCATAVAYKLAAAIFQAAGQDARAADEHLDLVALATIADVVPLVGENRSLLRSGLRALAATNRPGLRALMSVARIEPGKVGERAVGFSLAPRINAAGRLYRADAALELILTEDSLRAAQIAQELDSANSERRHTEHVIRGEAEAQIAQLSENQSAYVLAGERWHPGVIGIVAARLAERHRRPVVLISLEGEMARGSARSIEGYDLLAGLTACEAHLTRYGGHSAAAGMELECCRLSAFSDALDEHAKRVLSAEMLMQRERVDAIVGGAQLSMELAEELTLLAPFGKGNPTISLMVEDAVLRDVRPMGEGKHARFTIESDGAHARAVAFGNDGKLGVAEGEPMQATFALEVNEWKGVSEPRLVLRHAQPASEGARLKSCPSTGQAQSTLFPLPAPIAVAAAPS